jgi:hypothetical protein
MQIDLKAKERLLEFVGYGNLNAPYWFLGMEEGTGGTDKGIEANLEARITHFEQVADLVEAHKILNFDIPTMRKSPTQVWLWMAKIVRGMQGAEDWRDAEKATDYVRKRLGRKDDNTLLTELLPLPKAAYGVWPAPLQTMFPSRITYESEVLPKRKAMLGRLIEQHEPSYIFAYGSANRGHYKAIVRIGDWKCLPTRNVIEVGCIGRTQIVVMPFFGQGALSNNDVQGVIDYFNRKE